MADRTVILQEQFEDAAQQHEAAQLGMWTFLATEIMFFGGLFVAYVVYRHAYPQAFAEGSHHSNLPLGTLNTAVLLTSSLTMALAAHAAQQNKRSTLVRFLLATAALGVVFLAIKAIEYSEHFHEHLVPGKWFSNHVSAKSEILFWLYFAMTGLHALHLVGGGGLISMLAFFARRGAYSSDYYTHIEVGGLYWHFVDIVWVFLYPLFYLIRPFH